MEPPLGTTSLVSYFEKLVEEIFSPKGIVIGSKVDHEGYSTRMDKDYYGLVQDYSSWLVKTLRKVRPLKKIIKDDIQKVIEIREIEGKNISALLQSGEWPDIKIKVRTRRNNQARAGADEFAERYSSHTNKTARIELPNPLLYRVG